MAPWQAERTAKRLPSSLVGSSMLWSEASWMPTRPPPVGSFGDWRALSQPGTQKPPVLSRKRLLSERRKLPMPTHSFWGK